MRTVVENCQVTYIVISCLSDVVLLCYTVDLIKDIEDVNLEDNTVEENLRNEACKPRYSLLKTFRP